MLFSKSMRFLWMLLIIVHATNASNPVSKDYVDPNDTEDNAFLWKNLFMKLNAVLSETDKLSQSLMDVSKRLDELKKRQADHESQLTKLTDNVNGIREDTRKRLDNLENRFTHLSSNISRLDAVISPQWTTILRRQDASVDFNRNWYEYKQGFGNPHASFFIGLEKLHQLTTYGSPQELLIILIDFENQTRYATYDKFRIGSEAEHYAISELGTYAGDSGDGMTYHKGKSFTTFDRDNNKGKIRDCPQYFKGGWWFHEPCYNGHLHGPYRQQNDSRTFGVSWDPWRGWNYSLKYAAMMIRPKL